MTHGRYAVDLIELDSVTSRLAGLVGHVADNLDELAPTIEALASSWSGTSHQAQVAALADWVDAARAMQRGIDSMRIAAERAFDRYTNVGQTNLGVLGRA